MVVSMKNKAKICIATGVFSFTLIGYVTGYYIASTNTSTVTPQDPQVIYTNVPKQKLSITSNFFKISPVQYYASNEEEYIKTKISLTNEGRLYLPTDLFMNEYDMNIYLKNNKTNDLYLLISNLDWNINENKEFNILIDKNEITDIQLLSDLNAQIEKVNEGLESNLLYTVEVSPKTDSGNVMRTNGIVTKAN